MNQWHPIKTAPKDGTWIILRGGITNERSWVWENVTEKFNDIYRPVIAKYIDEGDDSYWSFAYYDSAWRSSYENPTHWMPLPTPPESA